VLLSVTDAQDLLQTNVIDWGTETVPLAAAGGRTLRQPIVSDRDQPPFDRVAMDGIALNHAPYATGQRRFPIAHLQAAGDAPKALSDPTQCVEIMTGAALPPGTTTVVRYEDLERAGDSFLLPDGIADRTNIHYRAKDVSDGEVLSEPGRQIGVAEIGMLATCGYAEVVVSRLPRTVIVATGNELVPVTETPLPHQIRRSNYYKLRELLRPLGVDADLLHLRDEPAKLRDRLAQAVQDYDLIILSGGVSKGKLDFVPGILTELGVNKLLHGIAQRPGKPLWVGRQAETMVFGLPGNPVSSVSCLIHFVLPFLRACLRLPALPPQFARLTENIHFTPDLTLFERVTLRSDPDTGVLLATPVPHAGSGDAGSLMRSDGFMQLPQGRDTFVEGEVFPVQLLAVH